LFYCNFSGTIQKNNSKKTKTEQTEEKQRMKEKRVNKWRWSKRRSDKKMRGTRAQIKGEELEKKRNEKRKRSSPSSFSLDNNSFSTNNCPPISLKCCSSSEKHAIIKEFDTLKSDIGFNHCYCYKRVAINLCMVS
jgi:hypothetical protein